MLYQPLGGYREYNIWYEPRVTEFGFQARTPELPSSCFLIHRGSKLDWGEGNGYDDGHNYESELISPISLAVMNAAVETLHGVRTGE